MNCSVDGRDLDCHGLDGHVLDCPVLDGYALDGRDPDWCARNLRSIVDWEDSFCLDEKKYIPRRDSDLIKTTRTDILDQLLQFVRFETLGFTRCVF